MGEPSQMAGMAGDGRKPNGQFAKGWKGGPGNPGLGQLATARTHFANSICPADIDMALNVIRRVMANGKDCDALRAAQDLLNRVNGIPVSTEVRDAIDRIQARMEAAGIKDDRR